MLIFAHIDQNIWTIYNENPSPRTNKPKISMGKSQDQQGALVNASHEWRDNRLGQYL